jgi:hypothetical protein
LRERAKNEDCIIKGEQTLRELRQKRKAIEDRLQDKVQKQKAKENGRRKGGFDQRKRRGGKGVKTADRKVGTSPGKS